MFYENTCVISLLSSLYIHLNYPKKNLLTFLISFFFIKTNIYCVCVYIYIYIYIYIYKQSNTVKYQIFEKLIVSVCKD